MSQPDDDWNPADGPPPTDEERAEARAFADALASPTRRPETSEDVVLDTALRVRATAHPDTERATSVARGAVDHALAHAGRRWYRTRWRWLALVAAAVVGIGGLQLFSLRGVTDDGTPLISHPATDVFTAPLPENARSFAIDAIADARMRSYRDVLFHGGARRSP